jgi:hypothetical protein
MITTHAYVTWGGEIRVVVSRSPEGIEALEGMPGTRSVTLTQAEATSLRDQLMSALATRPRCLDCDSYLHSAGSPSCPQEHDDCAD